MKLVAYYSLKFQLDPSAVKLVGVVLAHIFDELKCAISMHWMSSRGSKHITEQEPGQDLLESKREESL